MSQVFRILRILSYLKLSRRYYAASKIQNHYDVLGVNSKASKKDIRSAYLTLSKQMHPDTSKKDGHSDFVKITEAYNVLSRDDSREEYDAQLNYVKNSYRQGFQRSYGTGYYYQYRKSPYDTWENVYGRTGGARSSGANSSYYDQYYYRQTPNVSKTTVVLLTLLLSSIGFVVQMFLIFRSPTLDRNKLLKDSEKYMEDYNVIRKNALDLNEPGSMEAITEKMKIYMDLKK